MCYMTKLKDRFDSLLSKMDLFHDIFVYGSDDDINAFALENIVRIFKYGNKLNFNYDMNYQHDLFIEFKTADDCVKTLLEIGKRITLSSHQVEFLKRYEKPVENTENTNTT